jgi:hypothetical protein
MSTRCRIEIACRWGTYRIYRHSDGYPEGVISDLYLLSKNCDMTPASDPEYFLANFIFYSKLSFWLTEVWNSGNLKTWEYCYGVCEPNCDHGDLEYTYRILADGIIEIYECGIRTPDGKPRLTFKGTLEEAYKRYCESSIYKEGCHLNKLALNPPEMLKRLMALYLRHLANLDLIEWYKNNNREHRPSDKEILERIEKHTKEILA